MKYAPHAQTDLTPFDPAHERVDPSDLDHDQAREFMTERQKKIQDLHALAESSTSDLAKGFFANAATLAAGVVIAFAGGWVLPETGGLLSNITAAFLFFVIGLRALDDEGYPRPLVERLHVAVLIATLLSLAGISPGHLAFEGGLAALLGYGLGFMAGAGLSRPAPREDGAWS